MSSLRERMARMRAQGDAGAAVVMVLGTAMVMTLLMVAVSGYALSGYVSAKTDTDWNASVAAAQAGVDDYVGYLNADSGYWTKGKDPANAAFGAWVPVPGSTNGAEYRYDLAPDNDTAKDGLVRLVTSGRVDGEVRTIDATLRKARFFDYVYFSDYETMDPTNMAAHTSDPTDGPFWDLIGWTYRSDCGFAPYAKCFEIVSKKLCQTYDYAKGWHSRNAGCLDIFWSDRDVIDGRFHTNDQFAVSGRPKFRGTVTSGCPDVKPGDACYRKTLWTWDKSTGTPSPEFASTPKGNTNIELPRDNDDLRTEAEKGGCLFVGPTRIIFKADGKMAVHSPNTKTSNNCSTASSRTGISNASAKLPDNGAIYIRSLIPGKETAAVSSRPYVSNPAGVTTDSTSGGTSFPLAADTATTTYSERSGDVFVEGKLNGRVTVGAENDIIITGNLLHADGANGNDVLGLVANKNVSIYHPIGDDEKRELLTGANQMRNVEVWAAILAVNQSFNVQNFSAGTPRGLLKVRGSIAQRWRGAYGRGNSSGLVFGYDKEWKYDPRLTHLSPPLFTEPDVTASWAPAELAETPPKKY
jgi:hypothetical protein